MREVKKFIVDTSNLETSPEPYQKTRAITQKVAD
jgi:hypothetical protein